jgi:hypothetical protein
MDDPKKQAWAGFVTRKHNSNFNSGTDDLSIGTHFAKRSPDINFYWVATAVQSIVPVCRYAIRPVPNCMGVVIPAYEPDSRKLLLELSCKWYLECPACQHSFVIADSESKTDEISFLRIRQTNPDKP